MTGRCIVKMTMILVFAMNNREIAINNYYLLYTMMIYDVQQVPWIARTVQVVQSDGLALASMEGPPLPGRAAGSLSWSQVVTGRPPCR